MSSLIHRFFFLSVLLIVSALNANQQETTDFVRGHETALQKHAGFFDRNHDGVIYLSETYQGFRAIGCSVTFSTTATLFTHVALSPKTRSGKYPALNLPIELENIHKAKLRSDTGAFDSKGRFVPEKFEEIFSKHAKSHHYALTYGELMEMVKANRKPNDKEGWSASEKAWKLVYSLGKDKKGLLQRETIRGVFDGSLFQRLEKEHKSAKKEALKNY